MLPLIESLRAQNFAVGDGFLNASELAELNRAFYRCREGGRFQPAKVGPRQSSEHAPAIRGDETCWIDGETEPSLAWFFDRLDRLRHVANEALFMGAWDFEGHFARYPAGTRYERHVDRFASDDRRVLSLVLYLNSEWNESDGGALRIHSTAKNGSASFTDILPIGGRVVLFVSESTPHEVCVATRERRSFTGWFRRRA